MIDEQQIPGTLTDLSRVTVVVPCTPESREKTNPGNNED